jgi:hypothetical protein
MHTGFERVNVPTGAARRGLDGPRHLDVHVGTDDDAYVVK